MFARRGDGIHRVADEIGAYFMVGIVHFAGLVGRAVHPKGLVVLHF
jgi:glycine/serine hydroxymethyltransferase